MPSSGWSQTVPGDSLRVRAAPLDTSGIQMRVRLPEIRVEEVREPLSTDRAQSTTRLDSSALARAGSRQVSRVLETRTTAFVKSYGSTGSASLSLRGTDGNQSQILLDGLRVADPQTGQLDLSLVPTLLLESIVVEQGAGSARYGSGSLGGTVRLRTLRPTDDARVRGAGTWGAFGERELSGVVTGSVSDWKGVAAAQHTRADGDFSYTNDALFPVETVRRRGAELRTESFFGRVEAPTNTVLPGTWRAAGWYAHADRGLPGPANARSGGANQENRVTRTWVDGRVPFDRSVLRVQAQFTRSTSEYANPATGSRTRTQTDAAEMSATWSRAVTADWADALRLANASVDVGASTRYDAASLQDGVQQWSTAGFVDVAWRWNRVHLYPAVRLDVVSLGAVTVDDPLRAPETIQPDAAVVPTPRFGVTVRPLASDALELTARGSRVFRAPTFNERFYEPGGAPTLDVETGWSADAGVHLHRQRPRFGAGFRLTGFHTTIDDQIVWQPSFVDVGVQVWRPSNVGRVRTRGVEISGYGHLDVGDAITLSGGTVFTHTRAVNRANRRSPAFGSQLPYVPREQLKGWLDARGYGLAIGLSGRVVSERYYTADESRSVPSYYVAQAYASYRYDLPPVSLTLRADLDNSLNQSYEIVRLYPMPPRHLSLRLQLSFSP